MDSQERREEQTLAGSSSRFSCTIPETMAHSETAVAAPSAGIATVTSYHHRNSRSLMSPIVMYV